jgi:hypothetical protein
VLYSLSLIPSNKIVEKSALDLTADFEGQTKTEVHAALKEAKGGVLFVDEAYNLGDGKYGKEACDTLVGAMTSKEYSDVLIVIAGYPDKIQQMLETNSGLKSRFNNFFEFPDWEPEDCWSFFLSCAEREGFAVGSEVAGTLLDGCSRLKQLSGWANGRDVTTLWTDSKSHRAQRVVDSPEFDKKLLATDLTAALSDMTQARVGRITDYDPTVDPLSILDSLFRMDAIRAKLDRLRKTWAVARSEGKGRPSLGHFVFTGSPGASQ